MAHHNHARSWAVLLRDGLMVRAGLLRATHGLRGGAHARNDERSPQDTAMEKHLTPKQLEVMRCMAHGLSQRDIARTLGIDRKSVRERFEAGAKRLREAGVMA